MSEEVKYATIREMLEDEELRTLSPFASFSARSKGRSLLEEPCDIRTEYQRDRDRILHSKSFRRLKHKTQVFLSTEGDHYRTRLTHTLEVSQIARTISKALRLNQDLTEAIALGHDLGHTPYGHCGEGVLNRLCSDGFDHSVQSVRIVEVLEKKGEGLNLTFETIDGILNHQTSGNPATLEGQVVRICDKIAYLYHDVDDAINAKILKEEDIPRAFTDVLGHSAKERLNSIVHDVITNSIDSDRIRQKDEFREAMSEMRRWMFDNLYSGKSMAKKEEVKAQKMIELLFQYYMENPYEMTEEYIWLIRRGTSVERVVCDYISGMTDTYANEKFEELFVPHGWRK